MMELTLSKFAQSPATRVVSLGYRCATSYNLRRYFGHGESFPFDWWISPPEGIPALLQNLDVEWLYDPRHLQTVSNRATVVHVPSGIELTHEFPRIGTLEGPVSEEFRDHLDKPRSRTAHLIAKLRALNIRGQRILFVREGEADPQTNSSLEGLFPDAEWALADLPEVTKPPHLTWKGDPELWNWALANLGVRLDATGLNPFSESGADLPQFVLAEDTGV